ncbi:MAG: hypothetical protein HY908_30545 [Myxococcales bacterium]|nr:hypothetical protein [Myxococcales bacterium]
MKFRFTGRADRRIEQVDLWWREHRPAAPSLFRDELDALLARLEHAPETGILHRTASGRLARRALLLRTRQYVYYAVDRDAALVTILTVWGAARGREPKL